MNRAAGKRSGARRKNGGHWIVRGVNLGSNGELVKCWFSVKGGLVTVRRYQTRTKIYELDLAEVAGMVARRAQVLRCGGAP